MAPKYQQILRELSQRVDAMNPGDALPPEEQLAREFQVSPMTVRRALTILVEAKRVVGVRGKGTFVAPRPVRRLMTLSSFSETMRAAGRTPRSEVIDASTVAATPQAAELLHISAGDQVYRLRRLRFGDDTPVAVDRTLLPAVRYPGLLDQDLTGSLYAVLRRRYRVEVRRAVSDISAVLPVAEDQARLGLSEVVPCLGVRAIAMDEEGRIVELTDSTYRGDLYTLRVEHSPLG